MHRACEPTSAYRRTYGSYPSCALIISASASLACVRRPTFLTHFEFVPPISHLGWLCTIQPTPLSLTCVSLHPHTYSTLLGVPGYLFLLYFLFLSYSCFLVLVLSFCFCGCIRDTPNIHTYTSISLSHILSYILDSVCGFNVLYAHCICLLFSLHFFRGLCTVWPGHLTRRPSPTAGFVSPSSASTSHSPELFAWTRRCTTTTPPYPTSVLAVPYLPAYALQARLLQLH